MMRTNMLHSNMLHTNGLLLFASMLMLILMPDARLVRPAFSRLLDQQCAQVIFTRHYLLQKIEARWQHWGSNMTMLQHCCGRSMTALGYLLRTRRSSSCKGCGGALRGLSRSRNLASCAACCFGAHACVCSVLTVAVGRLRELLATRDPQRELLGLHGSLPRVLAARASRRNAVC